MQIQVLSYLVASSVYYAFIHELAKVPGPKLYAVSSLPYLYHVARGDWHDNCGVSTTVVRFTREDVSSISSDAIKEIFGHKTGKDREFEKDTVRFYTPSEHPHIINGNNGEHKRIRRLLSHAFSEKALRNQEDVMDRYVNLFIDRLRTRALEGTIIDIVQWYNFATFDLIGDLAFGEPFGCLEKSGYHPWVKMIFESVKVLAIGQIIRRLNLEPLIPLFSPPSLMRSAKEHHQLSQNTAMGRLNSGDMDREDFMSYILRHNDNEKGMTTGEIVENSAILIVAGSETTATLLSGATYYILTHRGVYDKLVQEIRSTFQLEDEITMLRVNQLQYMIVALTEAFRMCTISTFPIRPTTLISIDPPFPTHLPRMRPVGGSFVDGHWMPEGVCTPPFSVMQELSSPYVDIRLSASLVSIQEKSQLPRSRFVRPRAMA